MWEAVLVDVKRNALREIVCQQIKMLEYDDLRDLHLDLAGLITAKEHTNGHKKLKGEQGKTSEEIRISARDTEPIPF